MQIQMQMHTNPSSNNNNNNNQLFSRIVCDFENDLPDFFERSKTTGLSTAARDDRSVTKLQRIQLNFVYQTAASH